VSTRAVGWALDSRCTGPLDPATRLVLVVLADHAHADGTSAFPSKATISERIDVSERTVQRHIGALETLGLIIPGDANLVSHIRSDRRPRVWNLTLEARGDNLTPRSDRGDTENLTGSHGTSSRGDTAVSQTKNRTNNENPTPTPPALADPSTLGRAVALEDRPERGECNGCSETRLLVAEGLCRTCLMVREAGA